MPPALLSETQVDIELTQGNRAIQYQAYAAFPMVIQVNRIFQDYSSYTDCPGLFRLYKIV